MSTNILILAAGKTASVGSDRDYPACMTELDGVSLIERIVNNLRGVPNAQHTVAILEKDARKFHLDKVASLLLPAVNVIRIPEDTRGSACTALLASIRMQSDHDLLIVGANELVDVDLARVVSDFLKRQLDGGMLTFKSLHPRYSYVKLDEQGMATQTAAMDPISQHATTGIFWFCKTGDFIQAAMNLIRKDASVDGNFYIAPVFNELILQQKKIGAYELEPGRYVPLKNEREVRRYEEGGSQ